MRSKRRTRDQELADNAHLLRAWKRWHREQLDEVLAVRTALRSRE